MHKQKKVVIGLTFIKISEGDNFEQSFRKFKKLVEKAGVLSDMKKHECYEKPSIKLKKKRMAARKRVLKKIKKTRDQSF